MELSIVNKKWAPPICFRCENFIGITGMDMRCKKEKRNVLNIIDHDTRKKCNKNKWFRKIK